MAAPDGPIHVRADVIIAGAGMAGVTLALGLASGGLQAVLVDPAPFSAQTAPEFDGRASAISAATFRQWRALGASRYLEPHAQRIEQILVTDGRAPGAGGGPPSSAWLRFDPAEIANGAEGEPLGYMLENRHIRAGLAAAAAAARIDVLAPAEVAAVKVGTGGARVVLADGRMLAAPLVAGADGRASRVRREAGISSFGWDYGQAGVVATLAFDEDHQGVAYEHFLPSGPFAILPLAGRRASLVWAATAAAGAALKAARLEVFEAYLHRRFGSFLGRVRVEGPRFSYPLRLQLAERLIAPRVALLGDAAHAVHPIAGQGLNMGLKDAAALIQVLVEAARLGEDIGSEAVLARYARWRGLDNVGVALTTDVFTRLFSNDHPLVRLGRDVAVAAVNRFAPARRLFMREAAGAVGDLPRLLRGDPV
ncbi:MAG: UbiH/UbiF/VisC/COQ6 family ubiquinone biosynthesis hydroxylase [Caulobacteraceae bacterium]